MSGPHSRGHQLLPEVSGTGARERLKGPVERVLATSQTESLLSALAESPADPSRLWSLNRSTPCGLSRSEGCKTLPRQPRSLTQGEEPLPGASGQGPLRFPAREGAAAEPAAAVGNHTPQPAGARGLGEGERINYFLGAGFLHSFHSLTVAS